MPSLPEMLTYLERRSPRFAEAAKRWFVQRAVPFNRLIGLRIEKIAPDSSEVVLRLPARRGNQNASGTIHGGAIMALAETVHGVAVLWQFAPARHVMFAKESQVQFLTPGRGDLFVRFGLDETMRSRIAAELEATSRCVIELASVVTDRQGAEVARLAASYHLRRKG